MVMPHQSKKEKSENGSNGHSESPVMNGDNNGATESAKKKKKKKKNKESTDE